MTDDAHAATQAAATAARTSYGRLVAYLASISGDVAAAEDAMGEALVSALETWPRTGVPDNPDSWLVTVARRSLVDGWRKRNTAQRTLGHLAQIIDGQAAGGIAETIFEIPDKRLELLYACTHPAVDRALRSALMLQVVLGVTADRIASAFLVAPSAMGQRLVRAKAKIKLAGVPFTLPDTTELVGRTGAVIDAIYVAYSLGRDDRLSGDLDGAGGGFAVEALRLARLVVELVPADPEARGLLALLLHCEARAPSAGGGREAFVPLDEQDPESWSRAQMHEAEQQLTAALALRRVGPYQLQAAIQSVHNRRALTGVTDWVAISTLYEGLMTIAPTIGAAVARSMAVAHTDGPRRGLELLDELPMDRVASYQPYWVTRSYLLQQNNEPLLAREAGLVALGLTRGEPIKHYVYSRYVHGLDNR